MEPILILSPETLRNQLMTTSPYDRYFYDFHSPTHLNTGNYFIGVVIGYFYYEFKQSGKRHVRNVFYHILWHLSYMMTFALCFVGIYFYENDIEKGVVSALIGAIMKHIYAPVLGVLLVGIFLRYGAFIPKFYNYGMYRILARLSFSVYMVHVTIGSLIITSQHFPVEINNSSMNGFTAAVYVLRWEKLIRNKFNVKLMKNIKYSHAAALWLTLCIELPAHVIYKTIVNDSKLNYILKIQQTFFYNFIFLYFSHRCTEKAQEGQRIEQQWSQWNKRRSSSRQPKYDHQMLNHLICIICCSYIR